MSTKLFRFKYKLGETEAVWDTTCLSPITAIDRFHRHVQLELARKPEEYKVEAMFHVYNEDSTGRQRGKIIESQYDYPHSANPVAKPEPKEMALPVQDYLSPEYEKWDGR